jgi:inositol phosphorylceramide mannosyltransferase catalytic subunit
MSEYDFNVCKQNSLGEILRSDFFQNQRLLSDFHVRWIDFEYWSWIVTQYDLFQGSLNDKQIVPKKIHQIWIGGDVPKKYDQWRLSWKVHNPDFEYYLWNEKSILELGLVNEKQFMKAKNPAIKSDIARYEILHRFGGVYADTDFESIKKLDLKYLTWSFIAGQLFSYAPQVSNALMISAPGSRLLEIAINNLSEYPGELSPMETLKYCGPIYLTEVIKNNRKLLGDIAVVPSQHFYPWPNFMINDGHDRYSWVTDESVAIHHWEMSWMRNSIPSRILKKILSFGRND